jgi:hypothetical protein
MKPAASKPVLKLGRRRRRIGVTLLTVGAAAAALGIWSTWYDAFACFGAWRVGFHRTTLQVLRGGPSIRTGARSSRAPDAPRPTFWLREDPFALNNGLTLGIVAFSPSFYGVDYGWSVSIALAPAAVMSLGVGGWAFWWGRRPQMLAAAGRCPACGYSFGGLNNIEKCPECGQARR